MTLTRLVQGRKHFDYFIGVSLMVHIVLFILSFLYFNRWILTIVWNLMLILGAFYGWVATIRPDPTYGQHNV